MKLFDTLTGRVEEFVPLKEGEVTLYTCGPTVYDYAHIGNFRTFVFEDLLRRFLEFQGFRVLHTMNITDVDDKTIAGAAREGLELDVFTERFIKAFHEDMDRLNILRPNHPAEQPRATREIEGMIELIKRLVEKGHAYESDGSVYFRIATFSGYGRLSKKKLEHNIAGARVDVDEYEKEKGADFVLWKASREGEPSWDSPWGRGRPGWHIECSAMSMRHLGETIDIHAGGEDLVFPHHENEIAQSEACTGKMFVRYWLHSKFLLADGEKMSKSRGNFHTLRDLLEKGYDPAAIRYVLMATHYRTPLNFTLDGLREAGEVVRRLDDCYYQVLSSLAARRRLLGIPAGDRSLDLCTSLGREIEAISEALSQDLNVAVALAAMHEGVRKINAALASCLLGEDNLNAAMDFFVRTDRIFGLDVAADREIPEKIMDRVMKRHEIRSAPEFRRDRELQSRSDGIRDEIAAEGWLIRDTRPGQQERVSSLKRCRRSGDGGGR